VSDRGGTSRGQLRERVHELETTVRELTARLEESNRALRSLAQSHLKEKPPEPGRLQKQLNALWVKLARGG
jgi:nitrate/nitrite-specific signal transduction histidine kinase